MSRKQLILDVISDTCQNFLYYDRKEDEELGRDEIEEAIEAGEITIKEITDQFESIIKKALES